MRFIVNERETDRLTAVETRSVTFKYTPWEGGGCVLSPETVAASTRRFGVYWVAIAAALPWGLFLIFLPAASSEGGAIIFLGMLAILGIALPLFCHSVIQHTLDGLKRDGARIYAEAPAVGQWITVTDAGLGIGPTILGWDQLRVVRLELIENMATDEQALRPSGMLLDTPEGFLYLRDSILGNGYQIVHEVHRRMWLRALQADEQLKTETPKA